MSTTLLNHLQGLIAAINDVPVTHNITDFLIAEPQLPATDEQVLIAPTEQGADVGVFIAANVLERLQRANPLERLADANLADYCTALEGVSHFQYLVWCMEHARPVSLLELELQAEVDKYATATWLLLQQTAGNFPHGLHGRMFSQIKFAAGLDAASLQRYTEANRYAARYCQHIDERFLRCRRRRMVDWMAELRGFYRCSHHAKLRHSLH